MHKFLAQSIEYANILIEGENIIGLQYLLKE